MLKRIWHSPALKAVAWGSVIVLAIIPPHLGLPYLLAALLAAMVLSWGKLGDGAADPIARMSGHRHRRAEEGATVDGQTAGPPGPVHDGPAEPTTAEMPAARPLPSSGPDDRAASAMETLLQRVASGDLGDPAELRAETRRVILEHYAPNSSSKLVRDFGDALVLVGAAANPAAAAKIAGDVLGDHGRLPATPPVAASAGAAPAGGRAMPRPPVTPHTGTTPVVAKAGPTVS